MKSMTQGTTAKTLERTWILIRHTYELLMLQMLCVLCHLHAEVPEVDQLVPVLDVRGGDDQLLLLASLLAVVRVPQESHNSLSLHSQVQLTFYSLLVDVF